MGRAKNEQKKLRSARISAGNDAKLEIEKNKASQMLWQKWQNSVHNRKAIFVSLASKKRYAVVKYATEYWF